MTQTITATKDMVFQYPYSIEYVNDYKGGYDNFAYFACYEDEVLSKKDGQVNYAGDDARYTRRIDAVKFLLRTEHEAQVVPDEVIEALAGWFNDLHLVFESREEQAIEEPAQVETVAEEEQAAKTVEEPAPTVETTPEKETTDMNQLAQATSQAYQQYCEAFYSLTASSEEIEARWQAYKELYDQSLEAVFGKEQEALQVQDSLIRFFQAAYDYCYTIVPDYLSQPHEYIYGSSHRPISASWARIPDAHYVQVDHKTEWLYTWVVVPQPLDAKTMRDYELKLIHVPEALQHAWDELQNVPAYTARFARERESSQKSYSLPCYSQPATLAE